MRGGELNLIYLDMIARRQSPVISRQVYEESQFIVYGGYFASGPLSGVRYRTESK